MRWINQILILLTGGLFVFSGLIKINDPVGTQIKLEEYFEVFSQDFTPLFHHFIPFALPLAVLLCVLEVVLGVAMLARFQTKATLHTLLAMILFFTFLTFYSAYFNKVTDCGCFGDAIKLTPWESFYKDLILLAAIVVLWVQRARLASYTGTLAKGATLGALALSAGVAYYALAHLPPIDFRAYKVGNNIGQLMKPAEPCQYEYVMTKNGKEYRFKDYPTDPAYTLDTMLLLNRERCMPKITDYNIWKDTLTFTGESLKGKRLVIVARNVEKLNRHSAPAIAKLLNEAKGVESMILTSSDEKAFEEFRHEAQWAAPYYFADATVLKTIMRSDPGIFLLDEGTVKGKWHYNDVPTATEVQKALEKKF